MCQACDAWVATYYDRHPKARARDARFARARTVVRDYRGRFAKKPPAA